MLLPRAGGAERALSAARLNSRLLQKGLLLNATRRGGVGELRSNPVNRPSLVTGPQSLMAFRASACSVGAQVGEETPFPT